MGVKKKNTQKSVKPGSSNSKRSKQSKKSKVELGEADETANIDDSKVQLNADDEMGSLNGSINGDPEKAMSEGKAAADDLVDMPDVGDNNTDFDRGADMAPDSGMMGGDDMDDSVRALTLRDDVDYEDPRQMHDLGPEFTGGDDNFINEVEKAKPSQIMPGITSDMDDRVKEEYLRKFRKEVDFHHKVAYRFEKAYRLGKRNPQKKQALNLEIIDIISEHSDYIDQDQMALFYCLYFCIYYNNPDLVEFLRTLIKKMIKSEEKIDQLLDYIDSNGIERLRTNGETMNTHVYHMVLYQAVDDDLRVVYGQIIRQLKFIQFRDKDALQFVRTRDYELIRITFEKFTTKINLLLFFKKTFLMKSSNYRKYNQAFYEEILIDYDVEARVALNYRERFIVSPEEIYLVLEMYSKNDYASYFLKTEIDDITHKQFVELFCICLRNDSYKIALQIYLRQLTPMDINMRVMDLIIYSLKDTVKFHEMKMFYIHEHFNVLSIAQMDCLVDTFQEILHRKDLKMNPVLSQFNTIKYALLVYRISWKINEKRIYSLITKCSLLNDYVEASLNSYLKRQQHIAQLYKFMSEPIFHMTERKDSLDVMLEMNMENLLKHPVIVEVLNLVYEGKYSADSQAVNLSQTMASFFSMETTGLKSINERLIQNIQTFGDAGSGKQSSLQFNIWKQCIEEREQDEMLFTVIASATVIVIALYIDQLISDIMALMREIFQFLFVKNQYIFINAEPEQVEEFCLTGIDMMLSLGSTLATFDNIILVAGLGYFTSIIQKMIVVKLKDNVQLSMGQVALEVTIVIVVVLYQYNKMQNPRNSLISDTCVDVVSLTDIEKDNVDYVFAILSKTKSEFNFQLLISAIVIQFSLMSIIMLQRTQKLGELIVMVFQMFSEFRKFMLTFGLAIGCFIIVGRQLNGEIKNEAASYFQIIQDIFDGFVGKQDFDQYQMPFGKIFITVFVYLFNVLLLSFLVAMFINRYKFVYVNLDALRRMNIIKLKNSSSYDKLYGGVTITFFPVSIVILPLIAPVVLFKSERLSDFILKLQYSIMMLLFCLIGLLFAFPIIPLLYCKSVINAIFISMNNKRQSYKGQNFVNLIITIFLNPVIIFISLLIDLLSLPGMLMQDERVFEFKYPNSLEILNAAQVEVIMTTFAKIFYVAFQQKFAGKGMTLIELMVMHRKIFSLIENLHDLCCRGIKDYKEALANVQDYNMTKILTRKCSVPDRSGDIKQSLCEFNILYSIQMDIETYNYWDINLRDYFAGKLVYEKIDKNKKEEEPDKSALRLNAGVVFQTMGSNPTFVFKRDNADVMNNFFVNIVTRSFTNIEVILKELQDNNDLQKQIEILAEIEILKQPWTQNVMNEVTDNLDRFDKNIMQSKQMAQETRNEAESTWKQQDNIPVGQSTLHSMNSKTGSQKFKDEGDGLDELMNM